jgi:hypothetical protein
MHDLMPDADVVVLDRRALTEHGRIVQQAVESSPAAADLFGELGIVGTVCAGQIQHCNARLGSAGREDLVIHLLELACGPAQQDHGGAVLREGEGSGASKPVAGAGHQDDTLTQGIDGGLVGPGSGG